MLVMHFYKALSRKRRLKLAMAQGVSRNEANNVLWMEKMLNQCFERHNRESKKVGEPNEDGDQILQALWTFFGYGKPTKKILHTM